MEPAGLEEYMMREMAQLKEAFTNLKTQVNTHGAEIQKRDETINTLNARVNTLEEETNKQKENITNLNAEIQNRGCKKSDCIHRFTMFGFVLN